MSQDEFANTHKKTWRRFEMILDAMETSKKGKSKGQWDEFPKLYREICHHLDLSRNRHYGAQLTEKLNNLALRGHQYFYEAKSSQTGRFKKLFLQDFPRAVRKDWKLFWVASFLFYGPFIFIFVLIQFWPDMVYSVLSVPQVQGMEEMYDPTALHQERELSDDVMMLGHYIHNNTGIGLRTFGSSLILGVGSLFTLAYNGLVIGAVFGHLHSAGMGVTLFPFVIGHGSFELTAIVVSGMAGLKIGFSFLIPGNRTRSDAIKFSGRECMPLIYGFVTMFFIAAFIEAFWSPADLVSNNVKYTVGVFLWFLVAMYFIFAGREKRA